MDGTIQDERLLKLELRLAQLEKNEECQKTFLTFVKSIWPSFIQGRHHEIIAEKLERVASGGIKKINNQYGTATHEV